MTRHGPDQRKCLPLIDSLFGVLTRLGLRLLKCLALVGSLLGTLPTTTAGQVLNANPAGAASSRLTSSTATATRALVAPKIDGSDQDAVWSSAESRGDFRTFQPREDDAPVFRTEIRVAYDDRALYVFVRAYDPRPDSVVRLLSRRDTDGPPNDQIQLFIDSFNDRRSGYEYIVNAAGVKSDYILFDDSGFDQSWDGVWDTATRVDSLGWCAEFAIPLQQLRFRDREAPTFGLMVWRLVGRTGERVSWPLYRPSRSGYMSQTGTLVGVRELARSTSLQAIPYALARTRNTRPASSTRAELVTSQAIGLDARFRPVPSVSVDATFNPDFGQIESDPAVLNLSGFEVFQSERRPFFLQSGGQFSMPLATDGSALFFHSRRIGRPPALGSLLSVVDAPSQTTILGAAMVTARPSPASSFVALSAVTAQEEAAWLASASSPVGERVAAPRIVEPRAHYGVARGQRDFRSGRSGVGLMATRVDRDTDDSVSATYLPSVAQAAVLTTQHQSDNGNFRINGWFAGSELRGSTNAMSLLQLSNVHGFQRPDDGIPFDSTEREVRGTAGQVFVGKVAGGVVRYDASYRFISPGFDVNEMGFVTKAGVRSVSTRAGVRATQPGRLLGIPYRSANATLGFAGDWATSGLAFARNVSLTGTMQMPNFAQLQGAVSQELRGAFCAMSCTRGGPALVDEPRTAVSADITGNPRRRLIPHMRLEWNRDDLGRSHGVGTTVDATWRARTNLDIAVAAQLLNATHDAFFYRRFGGALSDTAHVIFAHLDQPVRSLTTRLNYTVTRALSVQWYAEAYLSRGTYSNVRELIDPRARAYDSRFRAYADTSVTNNPGGADFRQFRSNAVVRWEYRPGSTFFVVWTQGRNIGGTGGGALSVGPDMGDLFAVRPNNVIAVKLSYWMSR